MEQLELSAVSFGSGNVNWNKAWLNKNIYNLVMMLILKSWIFRSEYEHD